MQVNNCVDAVIGTEVNDAVEMFKTLLFEDTGIHVILKMTVVDWQANAVQTKRSEELGILLGKEVLEELG